MDHPLLVPRDASHGTLMPTHGLPAIAPTAAAFTRLPARVMAPGNAKRLASDAPLPVTRVPWHGLAVWDRRGPDDCAALLCRLAVISRRAPASPCAAGGGWGCARRCPPRIRCKTSAWSGPVPGWWTTSRCRWRPGTARWWACPLPWSAPISSSTPSRLTVHRRGTGAYRIGCPCLWQRASRRRVGSPSRGIRPSSGVPPRIGWSRRMCEDLRRLPGVVCMAGSESATWYLSQV
jgi:hypothetical protein